MPTDIGNIALLNGKTITKVEFKYWNAIALCSDGTVITWGANNLGQNGNGSIGNSSLSNAPHDITQNGILAGKTVTDIFSGGATAFAFCSDGTIAAWGQDQYGQLGDGTTQTQALPVPVLKTGALVGKTVAKISAANSFTIALCTDGSLVSWGYDGDGQLGYNDSDSTSGIPHLVDQTGVLAGKVVIDVQTGTNGALALCSDGTLASWGLGGGLGELGTGDNRSGNVPVLVYQDGEMAGKTPIAISKTASYSMALCSDGTVYSWGAGTSGNLGHGFYSLNAPIQSGASTLAGRTVCMIRAGGQTSFALCTDGSLWSWGSNVGGDLGIGGSYPDTDTPVNITTSGALSGQRILSLACGSFSAIATTEPISGSNARPSTTILTPASNARLLISNFTSGVVSGAAQDDASVSSVQLNLSRVRFGTTEYWTSSGWSSVKGRVSATLGTTGPNVSTMWTWDTNFPAAADLDYGKYRLDATAVDVAGDGFTATKIFSLVSEITPPTVKFISPSANTNFLPESFASVSVTGNGSDNSTVSSLTAKLYRNIAGVKSYWDGTTWSTLAVNTPVTVTGLGTGSITWGLSVLPAPDVLPFGSYGIQAVAVDSSGNSATATLPFQIVADATRPVVTVSSPSQGATVPASAVTSGTIQGAVTDNVAVASVSVKFYRTRSGIKQFWDGSDFVTASTVAPVNLVGAGSSSASWTLNPAPSATNLDAGSYTIYATATDATGNVSEVLVRTFVVTIAGAGQKFSGQPF